MNTSLALIAGTLVLGNLGNWYNNTFNHTNWVRQTCVKWEIKRITQKEALKRLGISDLVEAAYYCRANGIQISDGR